MCPNLTLTHKFVENAKLQAAETVLIIGGGPVGVELAGEVATDFPNKKVIPSRKTMNSCS